MSIEVHGKIFVRPAMGTGRTEGKLLIIRDPISMRILKEDGETKPRNPFWMRRVKCGDCLTSEPPIKETKRDKPTDAPKKDSKSKKGDSK